MIKKIVIVAILLVTKITLAQDENSLLWKISGNGLTKDSYLYGTMHVSQKIAFHLDDVFYESLLKSDFVGLESDPSTWLEHMFNSPEELSFIRGLDYRNQSDFYNTPFKLTEPKSQEIMFYLSREDMLLNGVLYRTNQMMQNFQEDTFLDMFIYQTAKKNSKKVFSLEDYKESSSLVKKATSSKSYKSEPDAWLQKKLKEEGFLMLMNNAYRDRKIHLLDSINKGMFKKEYMDNMLYIRNRNMVKSIDSITKKGSLFSAVGAAHLGGEKGVIAMLRNRGYTVEPLQSKITEKAELSKKEIEDIVIDVQFIEQTASDNFFTAKLPNKMYELNIMNNTSYISPDLTNGAYVIITRMNTFSKIYGKDIKDKNFDKLLFESIPGEIVTKKEIEKQGIKGFDILNKTKTGDFQRYHIYFTPLEVLIFKMHGKNNYVKTFGDTFFNSISFKGLSDSLVRVSSRNKGFVIDMPEYYSFTNSTYQGNRTIQAVDKQENYYFVKEVTLDDINYIEEDVFELERIQERFCKNLEIDYQKGIFENNGQVFKSNTTLKDTSKKLFLKTVTNGSNYYLLGFVSDSDNKKDAFFNSFKITDFEYEKDFEKKIDTSLYFSVVTNVEPIYNRFNRTVKKNKAYESYQKNITYTNNTNEKIHVKLKKINDLKSYDNIDSLWSNQSEHIDYSNLKGILRNRPSFNLDGIYNKKRLKKKNTKKGIDKNGLNFYSYYLKDSLSSKAIKVKKILVQGAIYELKTLIDTTYSESEFVTKFFNSFTPKDTILGEPLFKDKTEQFFKALENKDSLALDSYYFVNFKKKHIKRLIKTLKEYDFADNQLEIKEYLINELSQFKTKKVTRFLDSLYVKSFTNPRNQLTIAKSILKENSTEAYARFLKLLELDVPLSPNKYEINNMLNSVSDSLVIAKDMFPDLLNYTTIEEYKKPIYKILVDILDKNLLQSKNYESYKKQILNQARIELKRQLGKKLGNNSYGNRVSGDLLNLYVKLLFPFRKDKNVKTFFDNVIFVKNDAVKSTLIALQIKASEKYDEETFKDLTSELTSRGILYSKLHEIKKTSFFPKKINSKKEIYKALLFKNEVRKELKDSIVYLDKRNYVISNKKYEAYFFKSKINKNSTRTYGKEWKMNYIIFENKGNQIGIKHKVKRVNENLDTTKPIKEIIDDIVEENRLKNRKRVNLNSNRYYGSYNNGLF